jgi:hypothetical protein
VRKLTDAIATIDAKSREGVWYKQTVNSRPGEPRGSYSGGANQSKAYVRPSQTHPPGIYVPVTPSQRGLTTTVNLIQNEHADLNAQRSSSGQTSTQIWPGKLEYRGSRSPKTARFIDPTIQFPLISKNTSVTKSISLIPRIPVDHAAPELSQSCAATTTPDRFHRPRDSPPGEVQQIRKSSVENTTAPTKCSATEIQTARTTHGPKTIMVGSANYAPEHSASSRTISVNDP